MGLTPSDIDLRGKVAAVAFLDSIDGGQLRLKRIGGPSRRLSWGSTRDVSIGPRFIHWLALWGDRYYGYYLVLIRYDRRTEFEDRANVPSLTGAAAFARDGDTTYYMARLDPQCADCTWGVYRATDLAL